MTSIEYHYMVLLCPHHMYDINGSYKNNPSIE